MAFFKSVLCCSNDVENFAELDGLHSHEANYARYLELQASGQEEEVTPELLQEASREVASHFGQLSDRYGALLRLHERNMSEEAVGKVRTACGMSSLLVSEKLAQFNNFLQQHQDQEAGTMEPGARKVTLDDLRGFFELIAAQVSNLDSRFEEVRRLRNHKWKDVPELTVTNSNLERKESRTRLATPAVAPPTRNAEADLQRRERQRNQLRQMVRASAAERDAADTTQIIIFEGKKLE